MPSFRAFAVVCGGSLAILASGAARAVSYTFTTLGLANSTDVEPDFIRLHGTYHAINAPGGGSTAITGINRAGVLIGTYWHAGILSGFVAVCTADQQPCTQ